MGLRYGHKRRSVCKDFRSMVAVINCGVAWNLVLAEMRWRLNLSPWLPSRHAGLPPFPTRQCPFPALLERRTLLGRRPPPFLL
jgi:hypothetical protein